MMNVFICWSGDRSRRIAAFLHNWLPLVHQNIKPFMSEEDIGKGIRWTGKLASELQEAQFGIICLTPENLSTPWLHFEAGALSKVANSRLVPILFQLKSSDVQGPLNDFQAATDLGNKDEMLRVLKSINDAMTDGANDYWKGTFERLWGEIPELIEKIVELNKIQITSPINDGVLEDKIEQWEGYTYSVRGTLRYLPIPYSIWLLNAAKDGRQWPQEAARHDPTLGKWEGRIYLNKGQTGTVINAVVAPPTSQQFLDIIKDMGRRNRYPEFLMNAKIGRKCCGLELPGANRDLGGRVWPLTAAGR